MGSNSYFSDIFAYALPSLHCFNTHLKVPEKQNAETSAIIEVVIVVNHLIMCILLVAPGHYFYLLIIFYFSIIGLSIMVKGVMFFS